MIEQNWDLNPSSYRVKGRLVFIGKVAGQAKTSHVYSIKLQLLHLQNGHKNTDLKRLNEKMC